MNHNLWQCSDIRRVLAAPKVKKLGPKARHSMADIILSRGGDLQEPGIQGVITMPKQTSQSVAARSLL